MDDFQWNWGAGPVKDDEFRWNWAKANVDPSYKIQGPGIGSLLRAIHPDTQADAIQQMNNNLAADRANIETIAKQGALENDIVNKLYDEQADSISKMNSKIGHMNSFAATYSKAYADGDKATMELLETQAPSLFGDAAVGIIAKAKAAGELSKQQKNNYTDWELSVPDDFANKEEKDAKGAELRALRDSGAIDEKQYQEGAKKLGGIVPVSVLNSRAKINARASAGGSNAVKQDDSKLFDAILAKADPNASKSAKREWAMKKFREKYGREYNGGK
jgi:hypothetical protein